MCKSYTLQSLIPSTNCVGYDTSALLNKEDIDIIVDRINEKRNFVALHRSKYLPGAANMRKIEWSNDLAIIAQRWADQCDSSLRPDKHDECRNLESVEVGQNIATITGVSPGMNVRSFVDMWFMEVLDYNGNVSFYNKSMDFRANSFTQLIWAQTHQVGCGKAKFYIKHYKAVLAHRLVCNFAPKGNKHGKPIYAIGLPATQCSDGMSPDDRFPGLCGNKNVIFKSEESVSEDMFVTSLLRIRNITDNFVKTDIDPIKQNFKPISNHNKNETSCAAIKRSHRLETRAFWDDSRNLSRNYYDHFQQERGHSHVYHGHDHKNEFDSIHPDPGQDSRRYDVPTTESYISKNYRKHNVNQDCTRRQGCQNPQPEASCKPTENVKPCTRGQKSYGNFPPPYPFPCPCIMPVPQLVSPIKSRLPNLNCNNHPITNCFNPWYQNMRRVNDRAQIQNPSDIQYNDMPNPVILKSATAIEKQPSDQDYHPIDENSWEQKKVKYRNRIIREVEDDINFKPFWQVDEFANKNQINTKSIRFTTLLNRKIKKSRKTIPTSKATTATEFITLKENKNVFPKKLITEKYLSFDELMRLRKYSTSETNLRRQGNDENFLRESKTNVTEKPTETTVLTSEYTANTPFIRMKHCTRKLTCTWTAASLTDSSGNVIGGGDRGSKTPPGYVDGCTRTSTCTRDYMNRNKMDTLPTESTTTTDTADDEDYCERRSLNRRNLDKFTTAQLSQNKNYFQLNKNKTSPAGKRSIQKNILHNSPEKSNSKIHTKTNKTERQTLFQDQSVAIKNIKRSLDVQSYGDIYYYISQKVINSWKNNKKRCNRNKHMCNCGFEIKNRLLSLVILTLYSKYVIMGL